MSTMWKVLNAALVVAMVVGLSVGCKSKKQPEIDMQPEASGPAVAPSGPVGDPGAQPDIDLENVLFSPAEGLQPIYFAYDSSALQAAELEKNARNAEKIKEVPGVLIQIAGHTDERGTQEYNFALGERRALAVRDHLIQLGVPSDRLVTISYGEEFPAALGSGEAVWAQNRRAEFNRAQ